MLVNHFPEDFGKTKRGNQHALTHGPAFYFIGEQPPAQLKAALRLSRSCGQGGAAAQHKRKQSGDIFYSEGCEEKEGERGGGFPFLIGSRRPSPATAVSNRGDGG